MDAASSAGERLIAEVNQGGEMFESVIRQIDPLVTIKKVHAVQWQKQFVRSTHKSTDCS